MTVTNKFRLGMNFGEKLAGKTKGGERGNSNSEIGKSTAACIMRSGVIETFVLCPSEYRPFYAVAVLNGKREWRFSLCAKVNASGSRCFIYIDCGRKRQDSVFYYSTSQSKKVEKIQSRRDCLWH